MAKATEVVTCPTCGKQVLARGIGGHMAGMHQERRGVRIELEELRTRLDQVQHFVSSIRLLVPRTVKDGETGRQLEVYGLVIPVGSPPTPPPPPIRHQTTPAFTSDKSSATAADSALVGRVASELRHTDDRKRDIAIGGESGSGGEGFELCDALPGKLLSPWNFCRKPQQRGVKRD